MNFQNFVFNTIFYWFYLLTYLTYLLTYLLYLLTYLYLLTLLTYLLTYLCLQTSITREWPELETWFLYHSTSFRPEMCFFTNCTSYSDCIMVLPLKLLCAPILSSQLRIGDDFRLGNGFTATHKYCRDTSHSYNNVMKSVRNFWNQALWLSRIKMWGASFTS